MHLCMQASRGAHVWCWCMGAGLLVRMHILLKLLCSIKLHLLLYAKLCLVSFFVCFLYEVLDVYAIVILKWHNQDVQTTFVNLIGSYLSNNISRFVNGNIGNYCALVDMTITNQS
ncbi:unnamed protein product [Musa textilis]